MERISYASVMVVLRRLLETGGLSLATQLCTRHKNKVPQFTSWKFPIETGEEGETPWITASNGMFRELSSTPDSANGLVFHGLDILEGVKEPVPFITYRTPGDPYKGGGWHDKHVFLINLSEESDRFLRSISKWDGPQEMLSPPVFVEAAELWRRMLERGQPFHRAVLYKVIERFARDPAVYERYRGILNSAASLEAMKTRGDVIEFTENPSLV